MKRFLRANLNIANILCQIEVNNKKWHDYFLKKYENFLATESRKPDFIFRVCIDKKRKKSAIKIKRGLFTAHHGSHLGNFKKCNFYFKVAFGHFLLKKSKGFILHASSKIKNNKAYLFSGKMRAGKSTIMKLFPEYRSFGDDSAVIVKHKDNFFLWGTPFLEKNRVNAESRPVRLRGVYFLKKATFNKIERLDFKKGVEFLFKNIVAFGFLKFDKRETLLIDTWQLCYNFAKKIPTFILSFKKDRSFWGLIEKNN